ncbi:cyclopropane-fatty-acyl-phospholipid synthase [gamma proteobacterium HTCC5015]|nr:cyclopropane-fatty-acyl-phospholipid synthase [gamma proteobacterium HTCC5015]
MSLITLAEQKKLPDALIRLGIRQLLKQRLDEQNASNLEAADEDKRALLASLHESPIAIETDAANEQHYEVPADFYRYVLGKHFKYSACLYRDESDDLDTAEAAMLALYLERAELQDGQHILELGCGWGSLTLYMAEHLPSARILAVSNSNSQREYIMGEAKKRGLSNVEVRTCDVNELELDESFDRVVSIEMFEHMRNYRHLFEKIAGWLRTDGKLFVHIFCHRNLMYPFETEGDDNWMGQYFFTGGLMPSTDTLLHFQQHLDIDQQWLVNGKHYALTSEAWLENCDQHKLEIIKLFESNYGEGKGKLWWQRWRMFFMACAELFAYDEGNEWLVSHYRFVKRSH